MINTLIVDDNLVYVKNILNIAINDFDEVRVTHIATTVIEAFNILENNSIDLVFLDLKLPDNNGIEIIKKVKSINCVKEPEIIIISGDKQLMNKVISDYKIYNIISKLEKDDILHRKIEEIIRNIYISNNKGNIRAFISNELEKIGYNWKYKGTHYILEAIIYIYQSNNMDLLDNLEKNVYKYISYHYNKSVNNIKTNIIKATNYIDKDKQYIENPTPKLVISDILNKLIINHYKEIYS